MALFLQLRDWVNAAGLVLMLSAAACATSPAPQIAAPPPGQARIWFYRLWDPSESLDASSGWGSGSRPDSPRGNTAQAIKTAAVPRMPAIAKALRQPSSVPMRPNRNDSDAPIVKGLVYQAAMRARVAPSNAKRERPQPGHIHAGHGDAGQTAETERREQTVAQRHSEAGQRAKDARSEIELPGGPAIGQAD